MDIKNCAIELKSVSDTGEFDGFAAIYDITDDGGDSIQRGAFQKTLSEGSATLPLLWQHNQAEPIGRVDLTDTPKGLMAKGRLILSVPKASEVYTLMKEGIVKGLSIGYRAIKSDMAGAVRRLKEIRLYEVSVVTLPMQAAAQITAVKTTQQDPQPDLDAINEFRNSARDIREFYSHLILGD